MITYINCNVSTLHLLELCPYWSMETTEQMVRLCSPMGDNEERYRLPWVWIRLSDLAPLIFPEEDSRAKD